MKKSERARQVQEVLDQYFPDPSIPLRHANHYTLLIAVLLSAQSTDARVNEVAPRLFSRANTPHDMIQLSVEEIKEIVRPCGLASRKARAIWELSHQLIERHGGLVPQIFEELEALSGVGHKTASVVMAQGFGKPAFPVDTHIHRCARRWGLSNGKNVARTEKDLKALFPEKSWGKLHLQIIHFARRYCRAQGHDVKECPMCSRFLSE